jgi:hypothetical protein
VLSAAVVVNAICYAAIVARAGPAPMRAATTTLVSDAVERRGGEGRVDPAGRDAGAAGIARGGAVTGGVLPRGRGCAVGTGWKPVIREAEYSLAIFRFVAAATTRRRTAATGKLPGPPREVACGESLGAGCWVLSAGCAASQFGAAACRLPSPLIGARRPRGGGWGWVPPTVVIVLARSCGMVCGAIAERRVGICVDID